MQAPETVMGVMRSLRSRGHQVFLVGGCVRDMLLHRTPDDFDVATDATPDEIKRIFPRCVLVGELFGVIRVLVDGDDIEVTTFRADGRYTDGRRPDDVTFSSAEEDVKRRDLTINALLFDPLEGQLIDHVGGQDDIRGRMIRTVGDPYRRFAEDRLRMLRAIRFACQLDGFTIEKETWDALCSEPALVSFVSKERITQELQKIWMSGNAAQGLRLLKLSGLAEHIMPMINHEKMLPALEKLDAEMPSQNVKETIAWTLMMLFASRPPVNECLRTHFRLRNKQIKQIEALCDAAALLQDPSAMKSAAVIRLLLSSDAGLYRVLQRVMGDGPHVAELEATAQSLIDDPIMLSEVPRGVDMIDRLQGPELGRALRVAEDAILERRVKTREEAIALALAWACH